LTYAPTGGIVAAPTTSLPERIGGVRNWDYRYCWLRDATFTLLALMYLGYYDEARAWRDWLIRAVAGSPQQVQIVYGVGGERWLPELTVPWLTGYEKAAPVRIGNAAYDQLQLDVLGEVADALFQNQPSWSNDGKVFETVATALTPAEQKKVQALAKDPAVMSEVDQEVQEGQAERVNSTPTMLIVHGAKKYPIAGGLNYNLLRSFLDGLTK